MEKTFEQKLEQTRSGNIRGLRINPFRATGLFLYPRKTRGFLMFSRGYRKRPSGMKWVKKYLTPLNSVILVKVFL